MTEEEKRNKYAERARSYRLRNPQYGKKWREENKEHRREYGRLYHIQTRDTVRERSKKWRRENKDLVNANTAERRERVRTPRWLTNEDRTEIKSFYTKAQELTDKTGIAYEVDHVIPLRGVNISGLHVPSNLQVITKEENLVKSNSFD